MLNKPPVLLLGGFNRLHAFARRAVMPPEYAVLFRHGR
jgi:hypothetical protein